MSDVVYRTRPLSDDDVTIEVLRRVWYNPFTWVFGTWVEYSTSRSSVNKIEWEIIEHCAKIEKLLAKRMALANTADAQWEDSRRRSYEGSGKSPPMTLDSKTFKENVVEMTNRPDESWIQFFSPNIIRKYALGRKPGRHVDSRNHPRRAGDHARGRPLVPGSSGVTAYTLDEFKDKGLHIAEESGVDQVIGFREEKQGEGDRKARMKKLRQDYPKRAGESDNEWNNRLQQKLRDQDEKE